jgi:tetratricopeptide (TPR) repeat protein
LLATCHYSAALLNDHVTAQTLAQLNTLFDTCQHHHLAEHYVTCFTLMLSHLHLHLAVTGDKHVTHRDAALTLLTHVSQVTLGGKLQSDTCRQLSVAQALHGQDKQSKGSLLTALRTDPHSRATWLHLAAHYITQGQSAAAHECFTRARGLFRTRTSDYVAVTLKQIEWQYRTEQYLRALKACEELLQHCSAHQHVAPPVLHVILALTAANLNHKSKIQPALTRAVAADPSVAQWPIVALLQQFAT